MGFRNKNYYTICKELEENQKAMLMDYSEMLDLMTKITNLNVIEISVCGYDGYAHRQNITVHNKDFINCFKDMCINELKERK